MSGDEKYPVAKKMIPPQYYDKLLEILPECRHVTNFEHVLQFAKEMARSATSSAIGTTDVPIEDDIEKILLDRVEKGELVLKENRTSSFIPPSSFTLEKYRKYGFEWLIDTSREAYLATFIVDDNQAGFLLPQNDGDGDRRFNWDDGYYTTNKEHIKLIREITEDIFQKIRKNQSSSQSSNEKSTFAMCPGCNFVFPTHGGVQATCPNCAAIVRIGQITTEVHGTPDGVTKVVGEIVGAAKSNHDKPSKGWLRKHLKQVGIGSTISVILAILALPIVYDAVFPPTPSIIVEVNAQDGIIEKEGSTLVYKPRTIPASGIFPETFFVNIMNRGKADAHNFYINLRITPKTNDWFNYGDTKVVSDTLPPVCKAKSNECNIDVLPKDGSVRFDYKVELKPSDYELVRSENPMITFEYKYDEMPAPKQVIVKIYIQ